MRADVAREGAFLAELFVAVLTVKGPFIRVDTLVHF